MPHLQKYKDGFSRWGKVLKLCRQSVWVYPDRMKSKLVIKFLLALAFGAVFGQLVHLDQEKWQRLGREAFLANQANQFDHHTTTVAGVMIACAIFALGLFAFYEGVAFAFLKLVARTQPQKPSIPTVP